MSPELLELRLADVSERIRLGRERAELTLMQLSQQSGVAPSTIQKIESRQMIPSIAVIMKIAAGLRLEASDLIAPRDPLRLDIVVQRKDSHARLTDSPQLEFEKLSADILGSELGCWRVSMAPGFATTLPQPQSLDEVVIVVGSGTVELEFVGASYSLSTGDTLHCRSQRLKGFCNPGDSVASYLVTGRFPKGGQESLAANFGDSSMTTG